MGRQTTSMTVALKHSKRSCDKGTSSMREASRQKLADGRQ
jgi:hypothetical protein